MRFSWFANGAAKKGLERVTPLFGLNGIGGRDTPVVSEFGSGLKSGVTVFSPPQCTCANRNINERAQDNTPLCGSRI